MTFSTQAFVSSSYTEPKIYLQRVAIGSGDTAAPSCALRGRTGERAGISCDGVLLTECTSEANPPVLPHCHAWFASQGRLQKMRSKGERVQVPNVTSLE